MHVLLWHAGFGGAVDALHHIDLFGEDVDVEAEFFHVLANVVGEFVEFCLAVAFLLVEQVGRFHLEAVQARFSLQ